MKYRVNERKFINKKGYHGGAHIMAVVEDTSHSKELREWPEIHLELSDCNRSVKFDFSLETAGDIANSLYKLDVLIETFVHVRNAIVLEGDLSLRRRVLRAERRKEKEVKG